MAREWYITKPMYLTQDGATEPSLVAADPSSPATIVMPDDWRPGDRNTHVFPVDRPPVKPKPAHAGKKVRKEKKATEAGGLKKVASASSLGKGADTDTVDTGQASSGRAADQD